jgi:protein-arginine kinase activator protein McsA
VLNAEDDFAGTDFEKEKSEPSDSPFANYSAQELEEMLNEAIQSEDYEKASIIRDEIDKRKKI